ncbi:Protein kinase-like domain [Ilyonectria robusta]
MAARRLGLFLPDRVVLMKVKPGWLEEFENEKHIYERLQSLQGRVIPHFFGEAQFEGTRALILSEVVGIMPWEQKLPPIQADEFKELVEVAFQELNALGLACDDIKLDNLILVQGRVVLVDLESVYEVPLEHREYVFNSDRIQLMKNFTQETKIIEISAVSHLKSNPTPDSKSARKFTQVTIPQQQPQGTAEVEEPMAVDSGRAGLENSSFHPNAGASQYGQRQRNDIATAPPIEAGTTGDTAEEKALKELSSLVQGEVLERVWHNLQTWTRLVTELLVFAAACCILKHALHDPNTEDFFPCTSTIYNRDHCT